MRISVVVATHNGERHVLEQLESIAQQTRAPSEVIVSDDRSSDNTVDRVREFARTAPVPIRLVQNEQRLGYAENFLRAAMQAQGDLIAFSDQDDVWLPHKLLHGVAAFRVPSVMLWLHGSRVVGEELRPLRDGRFHTGLVRRAARANPLQPHHGSHAIFRRDLLRYLPPVNRPASVYGPHPAEHDEWIKFAALALGRVAWHRDPVMLYRRHGTAVTQGNPILTPGQVIGGIEETRHVHGIRAARERAAYLRERAADRECEAVRPRLLAAAERYDKLVPRLARRAATRRGDTRRSRRRSLLDGLRLGDYSVSRRGGLGGWALVQDVYRVLAR